MIFFQKHDGAQWCACSNVADRTTSHYPMQNGAPGGCGGATGGVRNCGTRLFDDVFCVRGPLLITPTVKGTHADKCWCTQLNCPKGWSREGDGSICTNDKSSNERCDLGYCSNPAELTAGEYAVWYKNAKRSTNFIVNCDSTATQPGIFTDALRYDAAGLAKYCSNLRDYKATIYILKSHGIGKYECIHKDGTTLRGTHYTSMNAYWGTIEYRQITSKTCKLTTKELYQAIRTLHTCEPETCFI